MIAFEKAYLIIGLVFKFARQEGLSPMSVVITDLAGNIVCSARDDGANFMRHEIAYGKAVAAIGMQQNTRQLVKKSNDMPVFFNSISMSLDKPFIPQTGAILICQHDAIIGAVGVSGGTGDQDEMLAIKAVEQLELTWK